jgi:hypothetical protein
LEAFLKYSPTPRDLFNPPPQAFVYNNQEQIEALEGVVREIYSDSYDERRAVLLNILQILKEHDEHVFEGVR